MSGCWRRTRAGAFGSSVAVLLSAADPAAAAPLDPNDSHELRQVVAVGIAGHGQALVLATPGLPSGGRIWRFRSFDTRELPQPLRHVVLATSGTKLFVQPGSGPGGVLDLTRQYRHNAPLQYVSSTDLANDTHARGHSHRLAAQRFVSIHDGAAHVIDDTGRVQTEYPVLPAVHGAITDDGVVLYLGADGTATVCGEDVARRSTCRELPERLPAEGSTIVARSLSGVNGQASARFVALTGEEENVRVIDPERRESSGSSMSRTEASLRSCLMLHRISMADGSIASLMAALVRESADTWAAAGQPMTDWRFFRVEADEELYAPVLQFARLETVFPSRFDMLEELGKGVTPRAGQRVSDMLYDRYLRLSTDARRERCTYYYRTHSTRGSWIIEYWMYYPFDVGGLGSHPHDPEHIFIEVDKLGGTPRKVIGAVHGYLLRDLDTLWTVKPRGV